jgi:hypothetical protein
LYCDLRIVIPQDKGFFPGRLVETTASAFARAVLNYWAIVWMASIQIPRLSEFGEPHLPAKAHISLRLGRPSKIAKIDIKAPTASGRVGESAEEYQKKDLFDDEK